MVFMQVAVTAIGIGIILMVGYIVVAQVRAALPTTTDANVTEGLAATQATVFAGFALTAVGIIVLVSFAIISVFRQ